MNKPVPSYMRLFRRNAVAQPLSPQMWALLKKLAAEGTDTGNAANRTLQATLFPRTHYIGNKSLLSSRQYCLHAQSNFPNQASHG